MPETKFNLFVNEAVKNQNISYIYIIINKYD